MKLTVRLNQKSIQSALNVLKNYKDVYKDFLEDVVLWIIELANGYLNASSIGENVKIDIRNGWEYEVTEKTAKIWNSTDQAVFVEFGVGGRGQHNQHPKAGEEGYEYNIPTIHKYATEHHPDPDTWRYSVPDLKDVDLHGAIALNSVASNGETEAWQMASGSWKIITTGSPAVMYAYNAIVTARTDHANPNGHLAKLWEKNVKRYLG
jgi:hypothetical protein